MLGVVSEVYRTLGNSEPSISTFEATHSHGLPGCSTVCKGRCLPLGHRRCHTLIRTSGAPCSARACCLCLRREHGERQRLPSGRGPHSDCREGYRTAEQQRHGRWHDAGCKAHADDGYPS